MSDEAALLRAICADPDEDTPRLALADYLDENGNPDRAAFIRAQVELATLREDSPHRRELAFRARQLLDANEDKWLQPREAFDRDWAWSRGFVETFSATPADLDHGHAELFRTHPFRRVWLWELDGDIAGVSLLPNDNRITALDLIGNNLNVNQLKKLAKATHLPHLRELGLMFNDLRDTSVKVLCGEPFFQNLEVIRLAGNPFGYKGRDQLYRHFRNRVSFTFERELDRLYPIHEDYLSAGWGDDFTQLLIFSEPSEQWLAVFDHAGNLLRTEQRSVTHDPLGNGASRGLARDAWLQELGHTPAAVKVQRFRHGAELHDFDTRVHRFDDGREAIGDDIRAWLEAGRFRLDLRGRELRFDRTGEVTDT